MDGVDQPDKFLQAEQTLLSMKEALTELGDVEARRLAELFSDSWLRNKLDRTRRIKEHVAYLRQYAPWTANMPPGLVIDIGPGGGELLEILRELGHPVLGIDAKTGQGGMGSAYLEASRILTLAKGIRVFYDGALAFMSLMKHIGPDEVVFINSRGSLEQVFSQYMDGPPHDSHRMATYMHWRLNDRLTREAMRDLFVWVHEQLAPGGAFLCHLNGSNNTAEAEVMLDREAINAGLVAEQLEPRVHVWRKAGDLWSSRRSAEAEASI